MANTTAHSLTYSNWSVTTQDHPGYIDGTSSGTAAKRSPIVPLNQITGTISGTVKGGFGWIAGHNGDDETPSDYCDTLQVVLDLVVQLVDESGTKKITIASASAGASRGGFLNLYDTAQTRTLNFNTANITDQQKQLYKYLQIALLCESSKSRLYCKRDTSYENSGTGNPSGSVTWYTRDTINVFYDETEMTSLYFDGTEKGGLFYNEIRIF